ncbi:MAG: diaminopimelate epimerase [Clostridia bacterium]|nr:diaminopimelate epimerase [Clostridia bacterium]
MRFVKMQGIGNDFIMFNGLNGETLDQPDALARRICDRHYGIGGDGLIWMLPSERADARMRVFNSDGGEAEMCGNGIRCAALFLRNEGAVSAPEMTIDTLAGVLTARFVQEGIEVDMGAPCVEPAIIPVASEDNILDIDIENRRLRFFCVSMGNPHAVTFDLYPEDAQFRWLGPLLERHPVFPHGANIEFCRVRDDGLDVRVWERGDGETLACGTGACASLVAAASLGLLGREGQVRLPGGTLQIRWDQNDHVWMTGAAQKVFEGVWADV